MKIYFDMHTHTTASGHAFSTFKENVEEAAAKGLFALGMSDHAPAMPGSAHPIYFTNFKCFRPRSWVYGFSPAWKPTLWILMGI